MRWIIIIAILGGCARMAQRRNIESDPFARKKVNTDDEMASMGVRG